jgi:hypothetical protein
MAWSRWPRACRSHGVNSPPSLSLPLTPLRRPHFLDFEPDCFACELERGALGACSDLLR